MTDETVIESLRFDVENAEYIEAGTDYRQGTRLYDSGVVGKLHLYLNGAELIHEPRFPAGMELSKTVAAMYGMIRTLRTEGHVRTTPFCCGCGVEGCTYVEWELRPADSTLRLTMENLVEEPIGDRRYRIEMATLTDAIVDLFDDLVTTLDDADVDETTGGSVRDFERWRDQLRRWSDE